MSEYREQVRSRIAECRERVNDVEKLKRNRTFKKVLKDLITQKEFIDSNWHQITDEKNLIKVRATKMAIEHLLNLDVQYKKEIEDRTEELRKLDSKKTEIPRDYDIDTNVEKASPGEGNYQHGG